MAQTEPTRGAAGNAIPANSATGPKDTKARSQAGTSKTAGTMPKTMFFQLAPANDRWLKRTSDSSATASKA